MKLVGVARQRLEQREGRASKERPDGPVSCVREGEGGRGGGRGGLSRSRLMHAPYQPLIALFRLFSVERSRTFGVGFPLKYFHGHLKKKI